MAQDWYYTILGQVTGPVTFEALRELASDGHLASDAEVRTSTSSWKRVGQVPELYEAGDVEEPELATDFDLDMLLAPSSSPTTQVSPKRKAQRAAVAAAAAPVAEWYYQLLGQEMGPTTQDELLQMIREGSLHGEDTVRLGLNGDWKRLDKTSQFAAIAEHMRPKAEWYCRLLGQELGPMTFDELQNMAQTGALHDDDDVRHGGSEPWDKAGRTRGLQFSPVATDAAASHDRSATLVPFGEAAHKREWYYEILGERMGPISFKVLAQAVAHGTLNLEDKARRGKVGAWSLVLDVPGLISTEDKAAHIAAKLEASRPQRPAPVPVAVSAPAVSTSPSPVNSVSGDGARSTAPPAEERTPVRPAVAPPSHLGPTTYDSPSRGAGYGGAGGAAGGYGSMASSSRTPAPPPRPAFTPPKRSSGPAVDFGALVGNLKDMLDAKAITAIAVLLLVGGYFGMSYLGISLFGPPGQAEYAQVKVLWEEVQSLHKSGDKPADWTQFQAQHEAELKDLVLNIEKLGPGSDKPLLQSMLFCARDHMPAMFLPNQRAGRYTTMEAIMADADQLAGD